MLLLSIVVLPSGASPVLSVTLLGGLTRSYASAPHFRAIPLSVLETYADDLFLQAVVHGTFSETTATEPSLLTTALKHLPVSRTGSISELTTTLVLPSLML